MERYRNEMENGVVMYSMVFEENGEYVGLYSVVFEDEEIRITLTTGDVKGDKEYIKECLLELVESYHESIREETKKIYFNGKLLVEISKEDEVVKLHILYDFKDTIVSIER